MQLQIGDRLTDSTGEWEVIGRPDTITSDKYARVRVQMFGQPAISELRTWGAHERVSVKRAETGGFRVHRRTERRKHRCGLGTALFRRRAQVPLRGRRGSEGVDRRETECARPRRWREAHARVDRRGRVRSENPARRLYERLGFCDIPGSATTNRAGGMSIGMALRRH